MEGAEEVKSASKPENLINTKEQISADARQAGESEAELIQKMYEWSLELMKSEKARLKGLGVEPIDL